MTPDQIKKLIQTEIQKANSASRFTLSPTSRHIHNGSDAPFAFQPNGIFAGIVETSSRLITAPTGWTIERIGTGSCQITHNLNEYYQLVWVACAIGAGGATLPTVIITANTNLVEFDWFDANGAAAPIDTTFYFLGVQVNNKSDTPAKYTVV